MRDVSDESCRENQNMHIVFSNFFENHTILEIMWKDIAERDRPQMTVWHMHIACYITRGTNTHIAFPLQQWLDEHASILRYTYVACLVTVCTLPPNVLTSA